MKRKQPKKTKWIITVVITNRGKCPELQLLCGDTIFYRIDEDDYGVRWTKPKKYRKK